MKEVFIDPWGNVLLNYEKIAKKFGIKPIPEDIRRFFKNNRFFSRGIIIAHRDFDKVFKRINQKKPFIQVTGIASSGKLHFGHKMVVDLFMSLKKYNSKNYFGICDIDGYVSRPDFKVSSLEKAKEYAINNLSHILALGLEEKDVFIQSKKERRYYEFAFELSKKITGNMFKAVYGHLDLGKISANLLQYSDILHPQLPEFEGEMPSVTAIGLEQDPHIRVARDIAKRLPYNIESPGSLYITYQGGLLINKKMSSSEPETAIFLDDSEEIAEKKLKNAFTGGRESIEKQKELGGQPNICRIFEMYRFHYPEDDFVKKIEKDCKAGKLMCKNCKKQCIDFVISFLRNHHKRLIKTKKIAEKMVLGNDK